jgi:hypothetical protein
MVVLHFGALNGVLIEDRAALCMDFTALRRTRTISGRWFLGAQSAWWWWGGVRPFCGYAGVCFESVTVSGAEALAVQAPRMGVYTKLASVTQGGRPVYQRVNSTAAYLFFWSNTSRWLIGSSYRSGLAGVASIGSARAACPDQATGWQAYNGSAWVSTYPITVVQAAVGN